MRGGGEGVRGGGEGAREGGERGRGSEGGKRAREGEGVRGGGEGARSKGRGEGRTNNNYLGEDTWGEEREERRAPNMSTFSVVFLPRHSAVST